MLTINTCVLAVWAVYWAWSIAAAIKTRTKIKKIASGETILDQLMQNVLMFTALYLIYSPYIGCLAMRILPAYTWLMVVGGVLVVGALVFADWARRVLACNWSSAVQWVENQQLVQCGPYAVIRHPIYTGMIVAFVATFFVQGTLASLIALVLLIIKYILKIRKEEQFLQSLFDSSYRLYKNNTWAMIPFIY